MKGVIFVEFIDVVEELYSYEMVDQIISDCDLASGGSYTAVGTYSHQEMLNLVTALSVRTNVAVSELIFSFGKYLFGRLAARYPEFIECEENAFSFVKTIENHIHQEVLKLYPEAELPMIHANQINDGKLVVTYRSVRPFADLALGLLTASSEFFGEDIHISRDDLEGPQGTHAQFTLTCQ